MSSQEIGNSKGKEELNETLARLDAEIEKTPNDIGLYHIKAALLTEAKMVYKTLELMDKILEIDPNDTKTLHDKGEILFDLGHIQTSLDCYNKAVEIDSDLTKSWLGRGLALIKLRILEFEDDLEILDKERRVQLEDALDSLTVVSDRKPNSLPAWNGKGYALYTMHRYDEALECFDKCIKINSDFIKAWYGRGKTLMALERKIEAIQAFQTAVDCIGNNVMIKDIDTLICKANSYLELGQENKAVDCINRFLEKAPRDPFALAGKGDILERIGRFAEALQCYKRSVEIDPRRAYIWHKMGNLKNESGEFETALDCYNEAVQLIPGFEEAWFKIGELLTIENKDEQAKECFGWVLEINPDNIKAQKAMGTFEHQKEILGSLFRRGRKKHKDGKKRKKRKRKRSKEETYEVPSQEIAPQDSQSELVYEEEIPGEVQGYEEEVASETEYYEESELQERYESEEQPLKTQYYKIAESHGNNEEDTMQQSEETNDIQWASQVQEDSESENDNSLNSDNMDDVQEEMVQSLESLTEGAGDLDPSSIEDEVNEIESELLELENESHDDDIMENVDSGLDELQDIPNEGPGEFEEERKENIYDQNLGELEQPIEEEPQETEPESYGDLGDNLEELERLLVEKSDHNEAQDDGEIPPQEEVGNPPLEEVGIPPQEEGGVPPQEVSQLSSDPTEPLGEERTLGLEDLEANLDELQDLLVTDSAHLDGQKVDIKPSGEAHLDGHQLQDQGKLIGMDAHSSDYKPSINIKESLETLMSQGKTHVEKREFKQAMNCFDMALEIDPQYVDAWGAKGDLLLEMDEEEEE